MSYLCHIVLVFFSPFSIAITSLGEERANLSAFRTFVRFVLVWICRFPLRVWEWLRFVIVTMPGPFHYLFFSYPRYILKCFTALEWWVELLTITIYFVKIAFQLTELF